MTTTDDTTTTFTDDFNPGWTGHVAGIDHPGDADQLTLCLILAHRDGRTLYEDIDVTIGGEVVGRNGQRIPETQDGFAEQVDELFDDLDPETATSLIRRFYLFDHSVSFSLREQDDAPLLVVPVPEESCSIELTLDYDGSFADLPHELVDRALTAQGQMLLQRILALEELDTQYVVLWETSEPIPD